MREPKITRTVTTYTSKCVVFDDNNNTTEEVELTTTSNTDKARSNELTDGKRLIKVLETITKNTCYSMTVDKFIATADKEDIDA